MREGLIYDNMVDVDERLKGWNQKLYNKLSFAYLIKCAKYNRIKEWNERYEAYLKSEWERLFPDEGYDPENVGKLFHNDSNFVRPHFSGKSLTDAILQGSVFRYNILQYVDNLGLNFDRFDFSGKSLTNIIVKCSDFRYAILKGSEFQCSNLDGAKFSFAHLDGADFRETNLKKAHFIRSHLENTNFNEAHLDGADFREAFLEGAMFNYAIMSGETMFSDNTINDKTDFTGTNLSVVRMDPKLRKHLERNIRKLNITNTNVFVAMKFDSPDLDSALENAIKPACLECGGLKACTVNEKAGDGWIPQRIKEEIQDARFVISDLTYRNPGVYYETGYADGLEIPVIQTCKQSWYDENPSPLHFDIAQRNTIFWKDNEDLKQQLILKIRELQANGK